MRLIGFLEMHKGRRTRLALLRFPSPEYTRAGDFSESRAGEALRLRRPEIPGEEKHGLRRGVIPLAIVLEIGRREAANVLLCSQYRPARGLISIKGLGQEVVYLPLGLILVHIHLLHDDAALAVQFRLLENGI